MKTIFTLLSAIFILWSCSDDDDRVPNPGTCDGSGNLAISFSNDDFQTRAFSDSIATPAEKLVNTAKIFIFRQNDGSKLFERDLTSSEISSIGSNPVNVSVPGMQVSTPYLFYMIINKGDMSATSLSNLQSLNETDITTYNGTWASVADGNSTPNRPGGFVMTGNVTQSSPSDLTQTQNVSFIMKRITAKLDIKTTIDPNYFGAGKKYLGTIVVDSAKILKTQGSTPLILGTPTTITGSTTLGKQASYAATANSLYENRFYIFENGTLNAGSRIQLALYATYTNNGISTPVIYNTELAGSSNNGIFIRNGAYNINANLQGLTGASLSVTITLNNWETVVTQNINLGS